MMRKVWYAGILGLVVANIAVWPYVAEGGAMRVRFFDVGQGDAIFIETPQGHQILIDGGPNSAVVEKIGKRLPFWDKSLDLVILTHPDADHVTGLVDIFAKYEVQNVLWTGVEKETNVFASWKGAMQAEGANVWLVQDPQRISWSQGPRVRLDILYATDDTPQVNDTSIVAKLVFGNISFLFPGDISKAVEQEMINRGISLDADVLKVPHHGSKFSSSANFLAAVTPEIAVVQVGKNNSYGHPTPEVLERLSGVGAAVLRTDLEGDIIVQSNGRELIIQ